MSSALGHQSRFEVPPFRSGCGRLLSVSTMLSFGRKRLAGARPRSGPVVHASGGAGSGGAGSGGAGSGGVRGRAAGADAPVHDLGLVDREAVVVGRGQARGVADGAVDVGDDAAAPAHDVVVVVADPRLV